MNKFRITTNGDEFRVEMLDEQDEGANGIIRTWLNCSGTGKMEYFATFKEAEEAKEKLEREDRRRNGKWIPVKNTKNGRK